MLKRILAFCLVFLLSVSALPAFAATDSDMNLLQDLGIIDLTEKTGFFPKGFTRADFAVTMCAALFDNKSPSWYVEAGVRYAEDIDKHANYNAIVTMLKLGYMKTNSSGQFRPSADITYAEAVYAFVSALGYKSLAQDKGGHEGDYLAVASKIGLLRRITIKDTEKLTVQEIGAMLANAMGIAVLEDSITNVNGNCLWDKLGIAKSQGKILANQNLGLVIDKTRRNYINIDGKEYYTKLLVKDEAVGSDVVFYTKQGDYGVEIISIFYLTNEETVTLESSEIDTVENKSGVIVITDNKDKKIELSKNGYAVVNGKTVTPDISLFRALKSGMVTFVDSDGDGIYDIAHMTILKQSIIDAINYDTEAFFTRFDNKTVALKDVDYQIYLDDEAVEFDALRRSMVVGIACDSWTLTAGEITFDYTQAKNIKLYATIATAEGKVSSYTGNTVKLGSMTLTFSDAYKKFVNGGKFSDIKLGDYIVAYQDVLGEIVYYEVNTLNSEMQYGYMMAGGVENGAIDRKNVFKIMDTAGQVNLLSTDTSFVLDGEKVAAGSLTYPVGDKTVDFSKRQLVRYAAKDGILKKLDTEAIRPGLEDAQSTLCKETSFDPYSTGQSRSKISNNVFGYRFGFKPGFIVFYDRERIVDESGNRVTDPTEKKFSVSKPSSLSGERYIAGYNADETGLLSVVVVYEYQATNTTVQQKSKFGYYDYNGHMVAEIKRAVNEEGGPVWVLTLAGNSTMSDYVIDPENLTLTAIEPDETWGSYYMPITPYESDQLESVIGIGDVVRFSKNSAGELNYLERIFDYSVQGAPNQQGVVPVIKNTDTSYSDNQFYGYVKVESIDGNYVVYTEGTDTKRLLMFRDQYSSFSVYNVKTGKTTMVPASQIPSAATGSEVRMFSRFYGGLGLEHIFYVFE